MKRFVRSVLGALALTALGSAACNPTAGVPITLTLAIEGLGADRVLTPSGWEIELFEARAVLGPLYAYAPLEEPMAALASPLGVARAHGGFDPLGGRAVRAELLDPVAVDVRGGVVTEVGSIAGFEGAIDELTLVLDAPRGELGAPSGPTRGHHLFVAGVARRDGVEVPFEGGLDLAEGEAERRIDGVPVMGAALAEGARLVLGVDADAWLAEADFAADPAAGGPLEEGSQPHRAWRLGARSASSYAARVEE